MIRFYQDGGLSGLTSCRVHPVVNKHQHDDGRPVSNEILGQHDHQQTRSWAEKRDSEGNHDSVILSKVCDDYMTCDSIETCDMPSTTDLDDSRLATMHKNGMDGAQRDEMNIDFSNISEIHASPSKAMMQENNSVQTQLVRQSAPYKRLEHPADKSVMFSFIVSLLFILTALIIFCPTMALLVPLLPAAILLRRCMACCCCCSSHRVCSCCCSKLLRPADSMWLHDTALNRSVVQCLVTLQHGLDLARIQDLVMARVVTAESKSGCRLYPRFTQKIVTLYSGSAWEHDPDFAIDNHIFSMPESVQTQEDLDQYVGDMASQEFSCERPLWEMHIKSDFGDDKDTLVLFRIHPSVSDGISLIRILFKSLADNQTVCSMKPRFGRSALFFNTLRAIVIGPLVFLQKWVFTRKDYNLLHEPSLSGKKVVAWSEPFSFPAFTRIKQVTRSTYNDVLLAVAAGNLRTYFKHCGVQNPFDILTTIPVDLRGDGNHIKMGNYYSLADITLPTNTEGTIPRLWELKRRMDDLKNSADPIVLYGALWILHNVLPKFLFYKIWNSVNNKATLFLSNLPGPDHTLVLSSRQIKSIVYWAPPRDEVAVSISFLTYADQLRMCVLADKAVLPDPHILTKDFIHQMETLSVLLANRRIPGEHLTRRIEMVHDDNSDHRDPTIEEIQRKMSSVQLQLQDLKTQLDMESQQSYTEEERALVCRVEQLKDEFRELLTDLRRKRMAEGSCVISDDEDESDGELRRPVRKRTMSSTSRKSSSSSISTARPLTTSPQPPVPNTSPCSSTVDSPSSPVMLEMTRRDSGHTSSPSCDQQKQLLTHEQVVVMDTSDGAYSPQVERKCSAVAEM